MPVERLPTGVGKLDELLEGGFPRDFFVAATGEPGTGKTVLCISFINQGIIEEDRNIYVTTEESRSSIVEQASQFGMDFRAAMDSGRLIIVDALMREEDPWTLRRLEVEELIEKVLDAKRNLGRGRARLVIDSLSAFWLDKPAMARKYSYQIKRVLAKWDFTVLVTSQYAITTSAAFGWGVEHVADGIIRFKRVVRGGILRRYLLIEKMRQTDHSLYLHEVNIIKGKGLVILGPVQARREDIALPGGVMKRIAEGTPR